MTGMFGHNGGRFYHRLDNVLLLLSVVWICIQGKGLQIAVIDNLVAATG